MQIIYQFDTHLDRREPTPILDAVQGESGRAVKVAFHEKGQPWPIPAGAHLLVRYGRPDHCGGVYDTLPDGAPACTVEGNTVTTVLVPQALAVAGHVSGQLAVISEGTELASFIFLVRVESDPSVGTAAAEDYVNLLPEVLEGIKDAKEAADRAEAAADRADQLAKKLNATIPLTFITGAISRETGAYLPNDNSTVSYYFPIIGGRVGLTIPSYFGGTIHYYDHQLTHLGYMELVYGATYDTPGYYEKQLTNGAKFARLVVQQMPSGAIEDTSAVRAYVTGSPGITPHIGQNGNWWIGSQDTGVSAGGKMYPLQIDSRKLIGFNLHGVYDGTETTMATVPTGFTFIEPSEYNPIPNDLYFHLGNMPAVLHGTFKATVSAETEYNFEYAYAFSGGFSNANYHITDCVVIEPATGKIYRFAYTNENTCTVTESTIGESGGDAPGGGGGDVDELLIDFTVEEEVKTVLLPLTDIAERMEKAHQLKLFVVAKKPTADEGTSYGDISARIKRSTLYTNTLLNVKGASPSNSVSWGGDGLAVSITTQAKGAPNSIVSQWSVGVNVSNTQKGEIYAHPGERKPFLPSDSLELNSSLIFGVGTRLMLYARGYLE